MSCLTESAYTLNESGYTFDAAASVWVAQGGPRGFPYSDGDDAEERLLEYVSTGVDAQLGSAQPAEHMQDWRSQYHLSPIRFNLLRPIEHLLTGDTLEVGAGCGALSRYIGELDGTLLALEGSFRRAKITAARCRSLSNTTVVCDTLESLKVEKRFDAVLLVGVLEYCRLNSLEGGTASAVLAHCRRFLKPDGHLILAIENQLGLKYFCGAPEDHLGEPYFGIEDRYTNKTAVSWGRSELVGTLQSAGWKHIQELYPFPDYKFPQLVLTESSLNYGAVLCDLLSQYGPAAENGHGYLRAFSEAAAWPVIARNRLVPEFANSLLLIASESPHREVSGAFIYSSSRWPAFQRQTLIRKHQGELCVERTALSHGPQPSSVKFKWIPQHSPFKYGRVYSTLCEQIFLKAGWTLDQVAAWARPYYDFLVSQAIGETPGGEDLLLPGDCLDCCPHNLVLQQDGTLARFDFEWVAMDPLPLKYVFFRALLYCFNRLTAVAPASHDPGLLNIVGSVMSALGLTVEDHRFTEFLEREAEFQSFVTGKSVPARLKDWQGLKLKQRLPSSSEITQFRWTGLEQSLSWRLTKPLRKGKAFLRSFANGLRRPASAGPA
ncbi:MAG: class I SAM-dependent methyltransferase [Bryobacteraceae bacterium]